MAIAMLMVAVIPNLRTGVGGLQAERAAFELAQQIRVARTLAITSGEAIDWTWKSDKRQATLQTQGSSTEWPSRFKRPVQLPTELSLRICRDRAPVSGIRFLPDGTSGEPDHPNLSTTVILKRAERPRYQIVVDGASGRVDVAESASVSAC